MKNESFIRLLGSLLLIASLAPACKKNATDPASINEDVPKGTVVLYPSSINGKILATIPYDMNLWRGMDDGSDRSAHFSSEIVVSNWTVQGKWYNVKSIITFPYITNPERITSAFLTLKSHHSPLNGDHVNGNSGTSNGFYVRRIDIDWPVYQPTTVNSNSDVALYGGTTTDQVLVPHTSQPYLDLRIDVTNIMRGMKNIQGYMRGIILIPQAYSKQYNSRIFYSYEYPNHTNPDYNLVPRLELNYD